MNNYFEDLPKAKQIERWEQVRRVLQEMPTHARRHHFDMKKWGYQNECGTIACAAGHCGLDPWFRRRGFKLDFVQDGEFSYSNISNVSHFFGMRGTDAIFYNDRQRPVSQVIREVKAYISRLKKQ